MTQDTDLIRRGDAPVVPAEGLAAELSSTMSRYDAAALPDDENGMAAPVMLGPEYVRNIIAALRAGCGPSWEVLPLTWESFGLEMWADSVGGRYYISGHGGKWSWSFDDDDPYHHGETVASEEAARSAANAHNSAHIATALRTAPPVGARVIAEKAYLAGFNAAGEGYNGEWPFHDKGISPDTDEGWLIGRDMALAALLPAGEGE